MLHAYLTALGSKFCLQFFPAAIVGLLSLDTGNKLLLFTLTTASGHLAVDWSDCGFYSIKALGEGLV